MGLAAILAKRSLVARLSFAITSGTTTGFGASSASSSTATASQSTRVGAMRGLFMSCAAAVMTPAASARPAIPNRNMTLHTLPEQSLRRPGTNQVLPRPPILPSRLTKTIYSVANGSRVRPVPLSQKNTSVLGALDVGAVRRHDHDLRPRADEGRDHGAHAVRQQCGLVGGGSGLTFHRRLGFHHFQGGLLGKLDRDRHPLVDGEHDLHFRLEVGGLVADDVGGQRHLVVGLGVHEMKAVAVLVKVLMLAILHIGAFDLLGRLEALRHLYAVADAAHVDLSGGGAFARVEAFGVENDIELAFEFDDIALAERAGDDFHGEFFLDYRTSETNAGSKCRAAPY